MRDAGRYLASVPPSQICGWGLTKAKNLAVYGKLNPGAGDAPLVENWATTNVTLTIPNSCGSLTAPIVVELQATVLFNAVLLSVVGLPNSLTFTVRHQERSVGE